MTVRQLCRIADRVGRNGALSFIIRIPCALLGELHGKSQLCKERVPQGHLVVVVQRQRQSHRCLGLFRLVLCQREDVPVLPLEQIGQLLRFFLAGTLFTAVSGDEPSAVGEPDDAQGTVSRKLSVCSSTSPEQCSRRAMAAAISPWGIAAIASSMDKSGCSFRSCSRQCSSP